MAADLGLETLRAQLSEHRGHGTVRRYPESLHSAAAQWFLRSVMGCRDGAEALGLSADTLRSWHGQHSKPPEFQPVLVRESARQLSIRGFSVEGLSQSDAAALIERWLSCGLTRG